MNEIFIPNKTVSFDPFAGPEIFRVLPLTESQTEIWLSCTVGGNEGNCAYNESNSLHFKGKLDVTSLKKAVYKLSERHESLRSSFSGDGKSMVIYENIPDQFHFLDLKNFPDPEKKQLLQQHLEEDARHFFDLKKGPLFKATLVKIQEEEYHFTFTAHHLVIDGWSIGVILEELGHLYSAFVQGKEPKLPPPKSFSEYAIEQNEFLNTPEYSKIQKYWLDQYKELVPTVNLPTDLPRSHTKTYQSARIDHILDKSLVKSLKGLGIKQGSSFVNILLNAFEVFLYRITGQSDIIIGMPASGQSHQGYYQLVGHCVNLLPLKSHLDGTLDFPSYLSLRKSDLFDAYENQQLTFGSLLKTLKIPRDPSRIPMVPVVFNVDFGMDEGVEFEKLEFELISNPKAFLNFEWFLNVNGTKESVNLEWTYNSRLFTSETMERMMRGFDKLLNSFVKNPLLNIDSIEIFEDLIPSVSPQKAKAFLPELKKFQTVQALIEEAALRFGSKTAIFFRNETCTYEELNRSANQLSHFLIQCGLKPGEPVGIILERSIEMIVAILATLKAGGAYLPIDTDFPSARIDYMLQDSARMYITQKDYHNKFSVGSTEILLDDFYFVKDQFPGHNPHVLVKPNDAAYIIYTSGSTGRPKGVVLEHHSLHNFLATVSQKPGISHEDRFLAVSSISFDIAILEWQTSK